MILFALGETSHRQIAITTRTAIGSRLVIYSSIDEPPATDWHHMHDGWKEPVGRDSGQDGPLSHSERSGVHEQWVQGATAVGRRRPDIPNFTLENYLRRLRGPFGARVEYLPSGIPGEMRRPIHRRVREIKIYGQIRRYSRSYAQMSQCTLPKKPFVFLAVHFQPEATTLPMAGKFIDPLRIASLMLASLPGGVSVAMKEHHQMFRYRTQWAQARDSAFIRSLAELKERGAQVMSADISSHTLVSNCLGVATSTGTIGWEALQRGRPVIVFGFPWYASAPGCYVIKSESDVWPAVHNVAKRPWPHLEKKVDSWRCGEFRRSSFLGPWRNDIEMSAEERTVLMAGYRAGMESYFNSQ